MSWLMLGNNMNQVETTAPNSLTKRAALLATAKFIAFALSLLLPLVLIRLFSRFEFGLYKQIFLILSSALRLFGLQVAVSAYYFIPREPGKKPQVVLNILSFYLLVGLVVAVVFAAYPQWVTVVFNSSELVPYMPLLGLAILLWLISSSLDIVAVANSEIRAASLFIVLSQLTRTTLILGAVLILGSVQAVVIAAVVQGGLQSAITLAYFRSRFGQFWRSFDRQLFKAQLANALPFGLGGLAYVVQSDLHNYVVSHYFDAATFAIYSVGCFQLPLFMVLIDSVSSVIIPEVARLQTRGDRRGIFILWASAVRKLAFFFMPVCALLFVIRHEFIVVLFTEEYAAAAPIFAINVATILLWVVISSSVLRAFDECKYFSMKLHLSLIPAMLLALYVGIHLAGLVGAIAAVALIETISVGTMTVRISQILRLRLGDLRQLAPVMRIVAATVASALATFAVRALLPSAVPMVVLIVCSSVFGVSYLALAIATDVVTDTEKAELRGALIRFYRLVRV